MIVDLLATDNYVSFNIKIAETFDLQTAVYLTELINISNKANLKGKTDSEGFFTVDRKYITKRTTLKVEEQRKIDKQMYSIGVFKLSNLNNDKILFNIEVLAGLISSEDVQLLKDASKTVKANTIEAKQEAKQSKRQIIINSLKNNIHTGNEELDQAYKGWIDGVYANPNGFLSNRSINIFIKTLDEFTNGDLDLALKILEIATVGGYRDCTWAIDSFNKNYKDTYYKKSRTQSPIVDSKMEEHYNTRKIDLSNEVF